MDAIGMNWIVARLLCEDGSTIEVAGNAFKVTGAIADVDDLKKAIKNENPKTDLGLPVSRLSLTWQDGHWVTEETMSASLRDTTEPSTWFRCFFSLGVSPSPPLAGQIATDSCCHQRTMLKWHACASAALEFERCKLASFCIVRASQLR
eukprot:s14847_g1.t2